MKIRLVGLLMMFCWLEPQPAALGQALDGAKADGGNHPALEWMNKSLSAVDLRGATLTECVAWLKKQGAPIEIAPDLDVAKVTKRVTLRVNKESAAKVVDFIATQTGIRYEMVDGKLRLSAVGLRKDPALNAEAKAALEKAAKMSKQELETYLGEKRLPEIAFDEVTVEQWMEWMLQQGVPVKETPDLFRRVAQVKLTLKLKDVSASEALNYVTKLTNTKFEVTPGAVVISPLIGQ